MRAEGRSVERSRRCATQRRHLPSMKTHIAMMAAGAATFALVQTAPAQAAYAGAPEPTHAVSIADVGSDPAIRLAQNANETFPRVLLKGTAKTKAAPDAGNNLPNSGGELSEVPLGGPDTTQRKATKSHHEISKPVIQNMR